MDGKKIQISSFTLHIIAMICMLADHLWATVVSGNLWLNCVGRIAFPIFAFMTVEGYFHTHNFKKYMIRLLIFAMMSEIPFNLMYNGSVVYPFHQNVLWTFIISLSSIKLIDTIRKKGKLAVTIPAAAGITLAGILLGLLTMVDYNGAGVFIVLLFYFFHGRRWYHLAGQIIGLYWINVVIIRGMDIPVSIFETELFIPIQIFSMLALIPIWLYRGKQGPHNKIIQYFYYLFYPVHMIILVMILFITSR